MVALNMKGLDLAPNTTRVNLIRQISGFSSKGSSIPGSVGNLDALVR